MKILKMKDLAVSYQLKNAKQFNTTELYLTYVIDEINKRGTKYKFHQFLLLIDVLYVILDEKKTPAQNQTFNPMEESRSHYDVPLTADIDDVRAFDQQMAKHAAESAKAYKDVQDPVPPVPEKKKLFGESSISWK